MLLQLLFSDATSDDVDSMYEFHFWFGHYGHAIGGQHYDCSILMDEQTS